MAEKQKRGRAYHRRHVSLFWPVILIGAGVFLLIEQANPGVFAVSPWAVAFQLWPLLLILLGIDLLFGKSGSLGVLIGAVLGIGLVGIVVALAIDPDLVPGLNVAAGQDLCETTPGEVSVPGTNVETASATITAQDGELTIDVLGDSAAIFEGDLRYYGALVFEQALDGGHADIQLSTQDEGSDFEWWNPTVWFSDVGAEGEAWHVSVNPRTPYDLTISSDDPAMTLDLGDMEQLQSLNINMDDGQADVTLPRFINEEAVFSMDDGQLTITLPPIENSLGVRVTFSCDNGRFDSGSLAQVSGDDENGVWESEGFDSAEVTIRLRIAVDDGQVTIVEGR